MVPSMSLWNSMSKRERERVLGSVETDNNKAIKIYEKMKLQTSLWRMSATLMLYTCLRNLSIIKHAQNTKEILA